MRIPRSCQMRSIHLQMVVILVCLLDYSFFPRPTRMLSKRTRRNADPCQGCRDQAKLPSEHYNVDDGTRSTKLQKQNQPILFPACLKRMICLRNLASRTETVSAWDRALESQSIQNHQKGGRYNEALMHRSRASSAPSIDGLHLRFLSSTLHLGILSLGVGMSNLLCD